MRQMAAGRQALGLLIVPTLCVGMPQWTLCVRCWDAERPGLHSHAERGNDQSGGGIICRRRRWRPQAMRGGWRQCRRRWPGPS
ncbi:hypothetical protein EGJ53_16465 [Pseudomonas fluorescens]|nr:hypothetical protein EGJ53_16465 [Pseudomonas fluorescens]